MQTRYKENMELFNNCKIFINSVPNESLSDVEYLELESQYSDILKNVVIEITENEKLSVETLVKKRQLIKKWNALMALDDYGVGYNGDISMLSLKPHIVKIDKLMITNIETDKSRQSIVQKLLVYAKEQGILVLAEGVETFSQMSYLVQAGVDFLQGYYIAKTNPLPNYNPEAIMKEIHNESTMAEKNHRTSYTKQWHHREAGDHHNSFIR